MHPGGDVTYEQILTERRGEVLLITLNRPDRMNAWTPVMAGEQADAIAAANNDPRIGAVVITGAGRGFCAGADTEAVFQKRISGARTDAEAADERTGMPAGVDWVTLIRTSKPIVAAVNGPAIGVGLTQILPVDQIVGSRSAKFGTGFIKMGLVPELGSTRWLVARMGFGRASDLCLSGRLVPADEAHALGLIDRVSEPDSLLDTAIDVARTYAANPDRQLRLTKHLLTQNAAETDLHLVQQRELAALEECFVSPEHREAVAAFREKRPPVFRPVAD